MKLTEKQRDVLRKMDEGWKLYVGIPGFGSHIFNGDTAIEIQTNTAKALDRRGFLRPLRKPSLYVEVFCLTPAGRDAAKEGHT